ncbi:MAG: hypothetical protein IT427_00800 [Pirellulales bacterium]|nr:hypothetical protein [Pirellulales bacterium]
MISCIRSFHSEIASMLIRGTVGICALAAGSAVVADHVDHFRLKDLNAGSRLEITTADRVFRAELLDPNTGETQMTASWDGVMFTEPRTVYLLGATQGRQPNAGGLMLVKMHEVQSGMGMELGVGSMEEKNRMVTGPVQAIQVERD